MKKFLLMFSCVVICFGFAFSLYQSANDYGLKENKLHSSIVAQSDETSGGGSGGVTCDHFIILCDQYLERTTKVIPVTSNSEGVLTIGGIKFYNYKRNTQYSVLVEDYNCRPHNSSKNMCDTRKQGTKVLSLTEGYTTSGDKTN